MGVGMICASSKTQLAQTGATGAREVLCASRRDPPKGGLSPTTGARPQHRTRTGAAIEAGNLTGALASIAKRIVSCESKSTFRSKGKALIFIHRSGYRLAPYRCDICGHWHLTSQVEGRSQ